MLEELDDDVDCLIDRLSEVNRNLDMEINKINCQIGETGPRHSTKFSKIALQLKDNLQRRVSETLVDRTSSTVTEEIISSTGTDLMDVSMDFAINRASNRQSNR